MFYLTMKGTFWPGLWVPLCSLGANPGGIFKFGSNVTWIIYKWFKVEPPFTPNSGILLRACAAISVGGCYIDHVHATYIDRGLAQCCGTQCKRSNETRWK